MKILALTILAVSLVGCSSSPKVAANKPQYCYTSQTITTQNRETVDSKTVLECTDDDVKRITTARLGMSANCGEFTYWKAVEWYKRDASGVAVPVMTWPTGSGYCRRMHIQAIAYGVQKTLSKTACFSNASSNWQWIRE